MLNILQQGGITIVPLVLCSIVSVAVSLERLIYLKRAKSNNYNLVKQVKLVLKKGKFSKAKEIIKEEKGPIAGMLLQGLRHHGKSKYEIRDNLELLGQNEIKKLEKRLRVLEFIAAIAPLLGLLGTVLGIINSFNILEAAQGLASPRALSSGISEALISTAVGLVVAIPTMLMYSYLTSLVEKRTMEMNQWFVDIVDLLSQDGKNV
ncbi:biopolymer transport protein [Halobacteroides halobius DSM 5150]|uniref:Biopolymer transport protein n=1 Tax=Halobacteroides halobius (strain ATCC 35273 / DSM 5150 / MD-1) TaxID=748449 RepID=L0KA13_HALHC|nr:MotA/TolQ/ExbB proton channel family protein [Halobacteroides halobius]AGB40943.1 biopolymer transport protein [Halobacteroides halobius DSM 5150]